MYRLLVIIVAIQTLCVKSYSQNWEITSKIDYQRYLLLEGQIDSQYQITMYLEIKEKLCGFEKYALQWRNRIVSGWYYYDEFQAKIPLIGYINGSDGFKNFQGNEKYKPVDLFVPENYLIDTISEEHCFPVQYVERFYNSNDYDFEKMNWEKDQRELPVELEVIHEIDLKTKAELIIYLNNYEMNKINISDLTELQYIEDLRLIDAKDLDDRLHITISFHERTVPGGSGGGQCGSGIESFLGYIRLKKNWRIEEFDYKQIRSCIPNRKVEEYRVIPNKPELGLIKG